MEVTQNKSDQSWARMEQSFRRELAELKKSEIPTRPGVYALFRKGERIYVGKAAVLQNRIWKNHCGKGIIMTGSALRRNIAELLGIASAADIKTRRYIPKPDETAAVRHWLEGCQIAWIECATEDEAIALEEQLKLEFLPVLTKR